MTIDMNWENQRWENSPRNNFTNFYHYFHLKFKRKLNDIELKFIINKLKPGIKKFSESSY